MDTSFPAKLTCRLPVVTLLVTGAGLLVARFPGWAPALVYDRPAMLAGDWWRLYTGHWVHFSTSHWFWDTLAFGLIGGMIEARRLPHFGWLCLLAPWVINGALLVCCPELRLCGGLSGLATAALVYLALMGLSDKGLWRVVCRLILLGVALKIAYEFQTGHALLASFTPGTVSVCPASHLAAAVTAVVFYALCRRLENSLRPCVPGALVSSGASADNAPAKPA